MVFGDITGDVCVTTRPGNAPRSINEADTRRMQQVVVASDETLTCDNRSHRRLRTQAFAVDCLCDNELDWSS